MEYTLYLINLKPASFKLIKILKILSTHRGCKDFKVQRYREKMTKIVHFSFTRHTTECQYFLMIFTVDKLQTVLFKAEKFKQDQTRGRTCKEN